MTIYKIKSGGKINRSVVFLWLLWCLATPMLGQDAGIGIQVGVNINSWSGRDVQALKNENSSFKMGYNMVEQGASPTKEHMQIQGTISEFVGFHGGFEINSELTPFIWLKHEFLFYTKGFNYKGDLMDANEQIIGTAELTYRSYHMDVIPVAIDFHVGKYQFFGGPYFSVLVLNEWRIRQGGNTDFAGVGIYDFQYKDIRVGAEANEEYGTGEHERYMPRNLSSLDAGLLVGAEMDLPYDFNVSFYVKQGIVTLIDTPDGQDSPNVYNRSINFAIGYTIGAHY